MPSGNSDSATTQQTTSSTSDQRVGADNGANVVQGGSELNISFSPEVATLSNNIVHQITDFSGGVVSAARDLLSKSLDTQEAAFNDVLNFGKNALAASPAVTPAASSGLIQSGALSSLQVPLLIAALGLAAYFIFKKK